MFRENRGALPNPSGGGMHTAVQQPGQVGVGFELEKAGWLEEAGHVRDPGVEDGRLEAAGRSGNNKLTVGPSGAVERSGVIFDKFGNFFVERVWDDVELIDVGEEGEDEDIDDDDASLDVEFAESAWEKMKFGAKLTHGFGVGKVGGGTPPDGDPEVSVNTDDLNERPDGGFDECERVSEVGSAGGKAMVEGRGAAGRRGGGGQAAGGGGGRAGRSIRKSRVTPGEGAGVVDNVVIEGERDIVNGKVDRSVIVGENIDFASITVVVVVVGAVFVRGRGMRRGNTRSRESKRRRRNDRSNGSREGGGRTRKRVIAIVEARDDLRFVGVNAHSWDLSEGVQEREGGDDVEDVGGGDGEVVGGSTDFEVGCVDEFGEQSVVAKNK
jgi:hypothetical protein